MEMLIKLTWLWKCNTLSPTHPHQNGKKQVKLKRMKMNLSKKRRRNGKAENIMIAR